MILKTYFYSKEKPGRTAIENEDMGFPSKNGEFRFGNCGCYYFAVADGTSSASYSREWAEALVLSYAAMPDSLFVDYARKYWESKISKINFKNDFAREKVYNEGSAASFIGIKIAKVNDALCRLNILAVGDCCIFICRGDEVLLKFPVDNPDSFTNYPDLIRTKIKEFKLKLKENIDLKPGDKFFLMTDAIAKWFLKNYSVAYKTDFEEIIKKGYFNNWTEINRQNKNLEIDDTTVLMVELEQ